MKPSEAQAIIVVTPPDNWENRLNNHNEPFIPEHNLTDTTSTPFLVRTSGTERTECSDNGAIIDNGASEHSFGYVRQGSARRDRQPIHVRFSRCNVLHFVSTFVANSSRTFPSIRLFTINVGVTCFLVVGYVVSRVLSEATKSVLFFYGAEMKARWADAKVLMLIDEYRSRPCLWSPSHPEYKHLTVKNEAWKSLAEVFDIDVEDVKMKIMSLLASLRRERAKEKSRTRAGEVYRPRWFAYKSLAFLRDRFNSKDTSSAKVIWFFLYKTESYFNSSRSYVDLDMGIFQCHIQGDR
ncbi:hypothetical protein J6590_044943 [Homalodisca vitripennis]|nr:hypothetical protein J6590_044943 [Homalodisca vitripennis]